jgi:hypothetical protein
VVDDLRRRLADYRRDRDELRKQGASRDKFEEALRRAQEQELTPVQVAILQARLREQQAATEAAVSVSVPMQVYGIAEWLPPPGGFFAGIDRAAAVSNPQLELMRAQVAQERAAKAAAWEGILALGWIGKGLAAAFSDPTVLRGALLELK